MCIVPILRSGLAMVDGSSSPPLLALPLLAADLPPRSRPGPCSRGPSPCTTSACIASPSTLDPVEYYNNLPHHIPADSAGSVASSLAILVDPIIATGGTCVAAIQTLREWGAKRILVLSVVGAAKGVAQAAREWPRGHRAVDRRRRQGSHARGHGEAGLG